MLTHVTVIAYFLVEPSGRCTTLTEYKWNVELDNSITRKLLNESHSKLVDLHEIVSFNSLYKAIPA